jgi:hypothetical protein
MRRRTRPVALALAALVLSFALPARGGGEHPPGESATKRKNERAKKVDAAARPSGEIYATFVTTQGQIGVRLFPESKPNAVKNFVDLAEVGR